MSSPLGHSEWESEHTHSHGFLLNSEKGPVLPQTQNGQTGLDFQRDHQDVLSLSLEEILQENAFNLDSLFRTSSYSGETILRKETDQSNNFQGDHKTTAPDILTLPDKTEGQEDSSDGLISEPLPLSNSTDLLEDKATCEEAPGNDSELVSSLGKLITISDSLTPLKVSDRTVDTNTEPSLLLVDLLSSELSLGQPPSGEVDPHGVSGELLLPSLYEDRGLPPLLGGETVTAETQDKGLSQELVTDLATVSNSSPEGLPESCLSHDAEPADGHRETWEALEGPVPLLDSEVPECDTSLSLCLINSAILTSPGASSDSHAEGSELELKFATPALTVFSEHQGEGDSLLLQSSTPLTEPSLPKSVSDEDALVFAELPTGSRSEHASQDLMDGFLCDVKHEEDKEMALDHSLNTELYCKETSDLQPPTGVQVEHVSSSQTEQSDRERLSDLVQFGHQDCHKTDDLDFPGQELNGSSPEPGRTSEQTLETLSLSKMVVSDSMAVVPMMDPREENVSSLKAVFDALDQDGDGFVRIEEFLEFAAAYGADQVKNLTKFLDPSGLGVISFEDFHRGISAISNGGSEPNLYDVHFSPEEGAGGCQEEYDEQNEVTDSAYLGSESTYSECETFTDEDTGALVPPEMHEDVETDSGIEATLHDHDDSTSRFSLNSELHSHSLVTVIGGEEEHFEDFGDSNNQELLETTGEGSEGEGDSSQLQTSDQVNCSSLLLSPSSGKRLSSKKVARHLLHNSSMTLDSMGELSRDILDLADSDITDKVLLLERRVAELEKDSEASGEQHTRLRQENLQLVHRANALEEQLKEQELRAEDHLHQETRRHKDALSKLERERGLELENLQARLQQLDEENSELKSCVPCLRANIERLEEEKRKLQDEVEDVTERLNEELESRRKMADRLTHERHQNQKEKECTQELIEDLRKQLEHLQLYKLEAEAKRGRSPSAGLQEYQSRTREAELEQEVRRLKQDNRTLKEQNDELNGQIINLSIQGAKNLVSASFSESLAAEINSVSRGELMEAIHKQEEINYRLQDYIDRIIVAIMESNPSILEVK